MMKKTSLILALTTLFMSFLAHSVTLNSGPWRFELMTTYGRVPFVIDLKQNKNGITGVLHNGKETIKLHDIRLQKDQLSIPLQTYEMSLELSLAKKDLISGHLVRHNKNPKVKTPVMGVHGIDKRYSDDQAKAKIDLNGRWKVTLKDEQGIKTPGVLIFEQEGNKLSGSLLTTTGDYRYFEGYASGNNFEVACFDGVYNYIIKGELKDKKLLAAIRSNYLVSIRGHKDNKAELPDAYAQTQIEKPLTFKFSDLHGKLVSLEDAKFKNKPVIVQFFGSWCPNCQDEMNYLIPWYKENNKRGVEIIALAFERSLNSKEAVIQLKKTQKKKNVPYTLLLAGSTADDKPMDKIPGLKNFISFPTTVFLNKKHEVIKVHAGFTGPGTGEFFEQWKKEFNETVDELLK